MENKQVELTDEEVEMMRAWLLRKAYTTCPFNSGSHVFDPRFSDESGVGKVACIRICGRLFDESRRTGFCPCNCIDKKLVIARAQGFVDEIDYQNSEEAQRRG